MEGCGSSGLRGRRRPLRIGGLCLQGFVLSWTLRYGSGLSQVSQWFHLLPWILCVSTRRHKTRCFWWNVCNGRILVFDEESVFHIGSDRRPREGEQWVTVGGRRGGRWFAGRGGGRRGAELLLLLLLGQPLEQLLLPGARLLLPPQLLLLQDLFSQALLLFYLQAVQPRFFVFIRKLCSGLGFLFRLTHRAKRLGSPFGLPLCVPGPHPGPRGGRRAHDGFHLSRGCGGAATGTHLYNVRRRDR